MSDPIDLTAHRWKKDTDPNSYSPRDCLVEALRQLDSGEVESDHIIIVHAARDPKDQSRFRVGYYQGGSYDIMATMGVLSRALHILNDDED